MLPIVRGSSSRTTGAARSSASVAARSTAGRRAIATTPVRGACGTSWARSLGVDRRDALGQRAGQVRGKLRRQPLQLLRVGGDRLDQLGAEAQRVLERVEALEHGQPAVAAGGSVALHEGVAHRPIKPESAGRRRADARGGAALAGEGAKKGSDVAARHLAVPQRPLGPLAEARSRRDPRSGGRRDSAARLRSRALRAGSDRMSRVDPDAGFGGDRFGDAVRLLRRDPPCLIGNVVMSPAAKTRSSPIALPCSSTPVKPSASCGMPPIAYPPSGGG